VGQESPHFYGHRHRLRERFLKAGIDGLADYELVELLLTLAIPRSDVKQPAKALIEHFGNLRGILDAPIADGAGRGIAASIRTARYNHPGQLIRRLRATVWPWRDSPAWPCRVATRVAREYVEIKKPCRCWTYDDASPYLLSL